MELFIVAPALNNYTYTIMSAVHDVFMYPVTATDFNGLFSVSRDCKNEEDFINSVQEILSSEQVHKVIASLLSQSRDASSMVGDTEDSLAF